MLEIFGVISSPASSRATNPFKNLEVFRQFNFEEFELSSNYSNFYVIYNRNKPEVYSDENIQVIIYGKCYTPLDDLWHGKNKPLTAGDISNLYFEKGKKLVNHVKGSYAIIINDLKINNVIIFTDPLNVKNIYYIQSKKQVVFSSSLAALCNYLTANGHNLKVDEQSFIEQTLFNIIFENRTLVKDIYEIPPGCEISIKNFEIDQNTFFNAFEKISVSGPKLNEKESIKQLKALFVQNIKMYSEGPHDTAVAITGGYDSRTVVSLLGDKRSQYEYFSYGQEQSWDISIPKKITSDLNLHYNPILLDQNFLNAFSDSGKTAALLGDGMGEISQANIVYVYSNYFKDKTSILTGLFGSELIKNPTSMGYFINRNVYELLFADKVDEALKLIGEKAGEERIIPLEMFMKHKEGILKAIKNNPFMTNHLPKNKKLFYYLLMMGMRKYFMKEIKIQKNWVNNLHPFFDIDFIQKLMETPFPWVYNYSQQKSLVNNLSIHKLYAHLINTHPGLSKTISTHGFRPKYLLKKYYLPLLVLEYLRNKKLISKQSAFNLDPLLTKEKINRKSELEQNASSFFKSLLENKTLNTRETSKAMSIQLWLQSVGLSL